MKQDKEQSQKSRGHSLKERPKYNLYEQCGKTGKKGGSDGKDTMEDPFSSMSIYWETGMAREVLIYIVRWRIQNSRCPEKSR